MAHLVQDTIGGYNQFVEDLALSNEDIELTLVLFDHEYEVVYENIPPLEAPKLTDKEYIPRGSTALLDAMGRAITALGSQERAVVMVITDGAENSSREYKLDGIKKLIEDRPDWEFQFFGADMDSIGDAQSLGMGAIVYEATGTGTRTAYLTMSNIVSSYVADGAVDKQ